MWSNIRLTGRDPSFVTQQVERCGGVPLHLFIDMPHTTFQVEGLPFLANFKRVAPIVRARRNQVQSMTAVIGGCRAFLREFGSDWPNLEELVWIDACPTGSRTHEQSPPVPENDHPTPKLRYLSAKQGLAWEMKNVPSLTALKLEGPMDIDILEFLRTTPGLEFLELITLRVQPPPENLVPIHLPRLIKLVMNNVEYGQLFVCATFPSLKNLTINPVEGGVPPTVIVWGKLQVPSTITTLKLEHLPHRRNKISITGSDGTKARSLSLTEHAELTRTTPMIQALCHGTSLIFVTSLSVGRGVPEPVVQLPPASIFTLISGLPRLLRLDLFPSKLTLATINYLCNHPLTCPELKILSLTLVQETCEEVFRSLSRFASDRADSERWLHRVDCVILRTKDSHEARRIWESMSQHHRLDGYLQCSCVEEVRQAKNVFVWNGMTDHFRCVIGRLLEGAARRDVPDGNNDIPEVLIQTTLILSTSEG